MKTNQKTNRHGYSQKGNRYHWKIKDETILAMGFKSKDECDKCINEHSRELEWRAGYLIKWYGENDIWDLVTKKGVRA